MAGCEEAVRSLPLLTKCAPENVKSSLLWVTPRPSPFALWCRGQPSCMKLVTPCPAQAKKAQGMSVPSASLSRQWHDANRPFCCILWPFNTPAWGFSVAATSSPRPFSKATKTLTASVHLHRYRTYTMSTSASQKPDLPVGLTGIQAQEQKDTGYAVIRCNAVARHRAGHVDGTPYGGLAAWQRGSSAAV